MVTVIIPLELIKVMVTIIMSLEDHNGLSKVPHICHTVVEHWCGLVNYKAQANSIQNQHYEPRYYAVAMQNPSWKEDMDKEINALEKNKTWN